MVAPQELVKVYTVNGAASGSSTSLPDWLTRKRAAKGGKGKRAIVKEQVEGTIDLIQHFEFPEASNKIRTTRDGHHAIATGVYKPQMRTYDLDELTLKFERHSDCENVDFVILSDDWTKVMQLQADRTVELHTQGGLHYRTRIPKHGRSLAYHFPSADALISASSNEVYRLNLDQGRFLAPIVLDADSVQGVNCIDINPAHSLFAFGTEGYEGSEPGFVDFWDPRSRSRLTSLRIPWSSLSSPSSSTDPLAVNALSSRSNGLSLAVGTSTGHTLLYDLRSPRPFATKDQGYGLPMKHVSWVEGGSKMAGDGGLVISSDKKVIKLWDRNEPTTNFASITPTADINDVHHVPGTGMLMTANESIQMTSYYIPQLGPAPRWCTFLDNITEEMEDTNVRNVYDDFRFVERAEIGKLGLENLIGTPALKPYMHGYFMSLKLYDAARVIANPHSYAEAREKNIAEKMSKLADSRIRARKAGDGLPKINRALAEKVMRDEERERRREEKKAARLAKAVDGEAMEVDGADASAVNKGDKKGKSKANLLNDPRFSELFSNPEFQVDENTREFALLNPTLAPGTSSSTSKRKTAVEEEEEESDKVSSDGLGDDHSSSEEESSDKGDSSDEGELVSFNPRARDPSKPSARDQPRSLASSSSSKTPASRVKLAPVRPSTSGANGRGSNSKNDRDAAFEDRRRSSSSSTPKGNTGKSSSERAKWLPGGGAEISWVPDKAGAGDDSLFGDGRGISREESGEGRGKKVEKFGAGMERGSGKSRNEEADEGRKGRTKRRTNIRSGSRNTFRAM